MQAPIALRRPVTTTYHDVNLTDDYGWLRDPAYPEVKDQAILAHLEAENRYFEAWKATQQPLIDTIYAELRGRIKEDDASVPVKDGDWLYWRSFDEGGEYRKWWRRPVAVGPGELILDEPALAEGHEYFRLGAIHLSEDGRLLAYATDTDGSERYVLKVRDLSTGADLPDTIPGTMGDVVFSADGGTLVYGLVNDQWRIDKIMAHRLGDDPADATLLYHEADPGFQAGVGMVSSRAWIVLATGDNTTSEVRLLPASDPFAEPILVRERTAGLEYDLDEHDGKLFITTNDTSPQFRLVTARIETPGEWTELIASKDNFYLNDVTCFAGFFVVEGREDGLDQVELHDYAGGSRERLAWPETSYSAGLGENPEYDVTALRLDYESMVSPARTIERDLASGAEVVLKEQEIPSGYDGSKYTTTRLSIPARDGTMIPVSVVHLRDFPLDGSRPLYLYGYGAYGIAIPPGFSTGRISLVDRGFAFAIAHIRGGDDLGQQWQLDGKLTKRWNAFYDFIDVAQGLIDLGYTSAGKICAAGGSAGGELMGVVANEAPELWGAIAAHVPFVDAQHHARPRPAADAGRMARMGQSDRGSCRVRADPRLLAVRQCPRAGVSADAGDGGADRSARDLLGTRQMGRQAA